MKKGRLTILLLGDAACLAIGLIASYLIRSSHTEASVTVRSTSLIVFMLAIWLLVFFIFDLYDIRRINPNPRMVMLLASAMAVNAGIGALLFYFLPASITPKLMLLWGAGLSFLLIFGWRRLFYFYFSSISKRAIAIIGPEPDRGHLAQEIGNHSHLGTIIGSYASASELLAMHGAVQPDYIIVEGMDPEMIVALGRAFGATILSWRGAYEELFGKVPLTLMNDELATELLVRQDRGSYAAITRLIEKSIALLVFITLSPIVIIACVAIIAESGFPFLYSQERVGKNGVRFHLYKLRTMRRDAEKNGPVWAASNDPRVTRVGAVLRKLHVDEIPQMWNVLAGDLSLVGPRPERPEFVVELEKQIPYYYLRHSIEPGFTGWAQIQYRYARTVGDQREKFEYDLFYLKNRSFMLNLGILLKTVQIIFTH